MTAGTEVLAIHAGVDVGDLALDVDLEVASGTTLAVVGPNGAGKSTLLRCVAGLLPITRGSIIVGNTTLDDPGRAVFVAPERRGVGLMFQDNLLFPHMTAAENVAFGLRCRGVPPRRAAVSAESWLDRVGLGGRGSTRPAGLSGGEAQRVALARALAPEPRLLLLDEPLSALDASAKASTRRELRRHLDAHDGVRIIVTHDPVDAAVLADEIVVLENGRVTSSGSLADLARRPRSRYVADLLGVNLLLGHGSGNMLAVRGFDLHVADPVAGDAYALIQPRSVALHRARPEGSARNVWRARVAGIHRDRERSRVETNGPVDLVAEITSATADAWALRDGDEVWISVKATEIDVYPT